MKKLITLIGLALALNASAQTNIVVDTSPLLTNSVKVVLTSNQWETLRWDYKFTKARTGNTNLTFGVYQNDTASRLTASYANQVRSQKLRQLQFLMQREPSEAKIDAALQALK